jgi:ABC-type glycerol-3-phosphate transport system substrate-binding protein
MHPSKRLMWFVALAAIVTVTAACGGQPAEEAPAPAETPAAEPAPAVEAAPEPAPVEEPVAPPVQELRGNIVEIDEGTFDWTSAATREEPGKYFWIVKLRNDTTQTLDITVTFEFLDASDGVIKTDRKTERLQPAAEATFRVEGEMERDAARAVESYTYSWDWAFVEG